ncbi:MAG: elongation factor G [Defluviitaleaceae bacterium]|nr:elongation factor G [Defluviitaleaceae bacterium]MCL2274771.1 elongation factor G [Defluviitaleaceae bacterium]
MKVYSANEIRNVAVLGHSGCGKTTLMEAALHLTKVTNRMGRTEDGNTVSDYDEEEKRRKVSIGASLVPIEWENNKINFIDTPGYFDFAGAVSEALAASDAALILADAKAGIEVGAELAFEKTQGIPRMILVNGMDDDNADFFRVVDEMRDRLGTGVVPLMLPFYENGKLAGNIDCANGLSFKFEKGVSSKCEFPADMKETYGKYHDMLTEVAAETDEALIEKYLGGEALTQEEITQAFQKGIADGSITPVLFSVANQGIGIYALLSLIVTLLPPASVLRPKITATDMKGEKVELNCTASDPLCAFVFKTIADPFVGRLSVFRVFSGTIKKDTPLINSSNDKPEKAGHLYVLRGKDQIEVSELRAGDIGAIAKLADTATQDTLCTKASMVKATPIKYPESMLSMAVVTKKKGDEDKISGAFSKLLEEDKTLIFQVNRETKQVIISGVGDSQLDVMVNRLKSRYKLEVELITPLVPYRETIKGKSDVQGKFVKQTGGGGQYGIVNMRFEPSGDLEKAYVFEEVVVGGNVPKQYFPAVEKGIQESVKAGPVAAYAVVGVKATLHDGKYHAVDSSELAFKMAASIAFKDGFMQAKPTILEPIMKVQVVVPDNYTGDIMGDMNKRRGRILGMEKEGKNQVIAAEAPHNEMLKYPIDLRSMTQGRGSFAMEFERYDEAPSDVQTKIIAARKLELEALKDA